MPRDWEGFYLLVGSAAAALIGLLFIIDIRDYTPEMTAAFGSAVGG